MVERHRLDAQIPVGLIRRDGIPIQIDMQVRHNPAISVFSMTAVHVSRTYGQRTS